MKKTLIIIFSIIAVLLIIMLVWNLVFGQDLIGTIWNAFAGRINQMWGNATGSDSDLIAGSQTVDTGNKIEEW